MDEVLKAINNYGFPMVIAAYLLIRFETKIDSLASCISELNQSIKNFFDEYMRDVKKS
ncbi:MAG: YvrJ family protein [Bacillota bacterium]|jgi:hypothetical protein